MNTTKYTIPEIIREFMRNEPKKTVFGNYRIDENRLVYRATTSEKLDGSFWDSEKDFQKFKKNAGAKLRETDGKLVDENGKTILLESLDVNTRLVSPSIQFYEENLIALKVKVPDQIEGIAYYIFLGNDATLSLVGRRVAYGNVNENTDETEIQGEMKQKGFHMLENLSTFSDDYDLSTFKLLELGKPTTIKINEPGNYRRETRRYSFDHSALLFNVDGKTFLCDADRRETVHGKLNYFLSPVNKTVKTIDDAYQSLKPKQVVEAETKGLKVRRVGTLFFIETKEPTMPKLSIEEKFSILGASVSYSLSKDVVKYIVGDVVETSEKASKAALKKVPHMNKVNSGRGYTIGTYIELDGVAYATGKVESTDRASTVLDEWYTIVDSSSRGKISTESTEGD